MPERDGREGMEGLCSVSRGRKSELAEKTWAVLRNRTNRMCMCTERGGEGREVLTFISGNWLMSLRRPAGPKSTVWPSRLESPWCSSSPKTVH